MPRKPRIHYPDAVYHVMLRGNGGEDLFFDSADRSRFLLLLQHGLEKFQHRIHAFCLMDNHVHLVLQVTKFPLSKIMHNLAFRYAQFMNRKLYKSGHLFQGRYKAVLVDADNYLLELVRYVHLNPLRAKLVDDPAEYGWSSHPCYLGAEILPWLTSDWVLNQFADTRLQARQSYLKFLRDGYADNNRRDFSQGSFEGRLLGSDQFVEQSLVRAQQVYRRPITLGQVIDVVCDHYQIDAEKLSAPGRQKPVPQARAMAAWLVRQSGCLQMTDLGVIFQRDPGGLSQAARRFEQRMVGDAEFRLTMEGLRDNLAMSVCQA